ncbi:MAG: AAA family ATPase [Flavobacteriaceae bacterium]|nr:AAA family ATPase [Flavobacteriaceae bacterium]
MENYTNRKEYIDKLLSSKDKDLIKVVSGLRRSGKSTLLELYREQLLKCGIGKRQIQFYNFELPENFVGKNWDDIYFRFKITLEINYLCKLFCINEKQVYKKHAYFDKKNERDFASFQP